MIKALPCNLKFAVTGVESNLLMINVQGQCFS
uniref:Uncharacterized protein n=1 Tax=Rhizophora mucronata TaxID=61149 RepID=A0A2P2P6S6_RHIMU